MDALRTERRDAAASRVRLELALDALAVAEGIEVDENQVQREARSVAEGRRMDASQRRRLEDIARRDLRRRAAGERLLEIVDPGGVRVRLDLTSEARRRVGTLSRDDPAGDQRSRPREDLRKGRGGTRHRPRGRRRRDLRIPRTERGRQVDDDQHPLHAHPADVGSGRGGGVRRSRGSERGPRADRAGLPGPVARRTARRGARTSSSTPTCTGCPRRRASSASTMRWRSSILRIEPARRCSRTRAACAAGSRSRAASCITRRCCSSTSRLSGSIRRRATTSGNTSTRCDTREHITIFMTTHYMDEAEFCDRIAIIDQGKIVALGTPAELKTKVGGDVVTITTPDMAVAADQLRSVMHLEIDAGRRHVARRGRQLRVVRAAPVLGADGADLRGEREAAEPRRRVPQAHRSRDTRAGEHVARYRCDAWAGCGEERRR